jgi:AcrR family transcriptional regulator
LVTAQVVGKYGYSEFNLDDVATELDVTKGSLYYYFPTKEGLVSASLTLLAEELTGRLEQVCAESYGKPATTRLTELIGEQLRIVLDDRPEVAPIFLRPGIWPEPHRQLIKQLRQEHDIYFRTVLTEGAESGEFSIDSVDMTLHALHGVLNHAPTWYRGSSRAALNRTIDELTAVAMRLVREPA